jgi:hypothetical protein
MQETSAHLFHFNLLLPVAVYDGTFWCLQLRRAELVLLHPVEDDYFPEDTLEWLGRRPHLARHHHVRLGIQSDLDR